MRCANCGSDNLDGKAFCGDCGAAMPMRCPKCGAANPAGKAFCGDCGASLSARAPGPAPRRSAIETAINPSVIPSAARNLESDASAPPEGERKTVTALFADIKGSMELIEDLDPEEARAIVDPALKLMMEAVHRYEGFVAQSTGDGIFALFGAPVAHEDHPQRALYAALRMQEEIRRYSDRLRTEGRQPLQARVGVNTGEVVMRSVSTGEHAEYVPVGHATSLAARMQVLAPIGSIAITATTQRLVEGYFALKALGPTKVKGVSEPINVYEVTGLGPLRTRLQRSAGRGLSKFVGRQAEMESLKRAAEQVKAGHGQIAAAMAEAGVGKSRLFYEFKVTSQSGWMVLETFSVSHGKASAYLPVIDLLHRYFKISADDDVRSRRAKVTGNVLTLDRALEDTLPYLFGLLGLVEGDDPLAQMDVQIRRRRTHDAIKRLLLRESLSQPLMVMFEDLHWIDEETQALLGLLADSIGTSRILLLVNYRPEYTHQWGSKTYYTQLRLDPLGKESAEEMLTALLGGTAPSPSPSPATERARGQTDAVDRPLATSPAPATGSQGASRERSSGDMEVAGRVRVPEPDSLSSLKRLIIERTEGNPFFMEETVLVLLDEGALVRNGTVKLTKPLGELKIPPTVQAILAARIDRLPAEEKDLLQTLAVIGKEFPSRLIKEVLHPHPPAAASGGLSRKGAGEAPDSHPSAPLARSVAVEGHPSTPLARSFAGEGQGEGSEELERMLTNLQLGEFIYEQPAVADVEYTFKHALTLEVAYNSVLSERRRMLHERTGAAIETLYAANLDDHVNDLAHHYRRSGDAEKAAEYLSCAAQQALDRSALTEALDHLMAALELLKARPETLERARHELDVQLALANAWAMTKGPMSAENGAALARARELCEQTGDTAKLFQVRLGMRLFHSLRLQLPAARQLSEQALEMAEHAGDAAMLASAHFGLAAVLSFCGDFAAARGHYEQALSDPEQPLRSFNAGESRALWMVQSALALQLLGYPDTALKLSEEALTRARDGAQPFPQALSYFFAAQLHQLRRDAQATRKHAEAAIAVATELGSLAPMAGATVFRGWALAELGQALDGIAEIRRSSAIVPSTRLFALLAAAQAKAGQVEEGLKTVTEALERVAQTGDRLSESDLRRLKGDLVLMQDVSKADEAEQCFRTAIDVAREQSAKWWELRATMSLARLLAKQSKRDEARAMLAEIYGWFTEGFDTVDLKDAKALLAELS